MAEPASSVASCTGNETIEEENSSLLPEIAIGIDIGTSPCRISVWNGSQLEILKDTIYEMIITSSFNKDDGSSIEVSSEVSISQEHQVTIFNMRHLLGMNDSTLFPILMPAMDINLHPIIGKFMPWIPRTAVENLGEYLVELKALAESQLQRPIRNVVFTVPVSFSRFQISRIHRASAIAGLNVLKVIPQPTAVALLYAKQQMQASASHEVMGSESKKTALIFNMDVGYCDVAVIATSKGKCQIKALVGSPIGGECFLGNIMHHFLPAPENIFKKHVRGVFQEVITRLSSQTSVEVDLYMGNGLKTRKVIKRKLFDDVNKEAFKECESLIIKCLQDAKVKVEDINDVIIVGECCNIPRLKNLVTKIFKGKKLYKDMNPLNAAICGAAVTGAIALGRDNPFGNLDMFYFQFTPLAIGIRTKGNNFVPVIPRNTIVPTIRRGVFTTSHDNQTAALIVVYESGVEETEENHILGYFKITEIPEAPKGVPEIHVCMDIDSKNKLTIIASVVLPGTKEYAIPIIEAKTTKIDDGQLSWYDEKLIRGTYGETMEISSDICNMMEMMHLS